MNKKEALLEKYRYINVDYDGWDNGVIAAFLEKMESVGVRAATSVRRNSPAVYWRGFWSQGDGACFEGGVVCWSKFIAANKAYFSDTEAAFIAMSDNVVGFTASWEQFGSYCHENSLRFDVGEDSDVVEEDFPSLLEFEAYNALRAAAVSNIYSSVEEIVKDYCRELYRELGREYEYLTSDDVVWETIIVNGLNEETENEPTIDTAQAA